MRSLFKKKKVNIQIQKDLVYSMVRVIAQNQGDVLYELLELIAPFYGEGSVLSVIESESKEVLSTTCESDKEMIRHTASGVKDVKTPRRYVRQEKNAMYFRAPFSSIQVIPFRSIGDRGAFLMVEQKHVKEPSMDRCYEVLEIATRMKMYEYLANKNATVDRKTLLPNRDILVARMKDQNIDNKLYLGMFSLLNTEGIGLKEGVAGIDRAMYDMADVLKRAFGKDCYLVADNKIGVLIEGPVFEAAGHLQQCLDTLVENHPSLKVGAVLSPMADEVYRIMYLCEKACESCSVDTVLVIRNAEEYLNTGGEVVEMIYNGRTGEGVKETFQQEPEEEKETIAPESGLDADGEVLKYDFGSTFKEMELFENL